MNVFFKLITLEQESVFAVEVCIADDVQLYNSETDAVSLMEMQSSLSIPQRTASSK
jgi:hypothetical protein